MAGGRLDCSRGHPDRALLENGLCRAKRTPDCAVPNDYLIPPILYDSFRLGFARLEVNMAPAKRRAIDDGLSPAGSRLSET